MTGGAAASTVSIGASNPGKVKNDRGVLTRVTANPNFTVQWQNFDDAVGKVFYLVEAKVGSGDFQPVFRATPWLGKDQIGTTGSYTLDNFAAELGRRLSVSNRDGLPDYANFNWDNLSGVDLESYLNGVSMQSADNYVPGDPGTSESSGAVVPADHFALQNNFPSADAGYYGAASGTEPYESETDGGEKTTTVQLRYTFELQRPNIGQLDYLFSEDTNYPAEGTDAEKAEYAAQQISQLEASDVNFGNSEIVMNGEDGNTDFPSPSGITYNALQANAGGHVGILVANAAFDVTVKNQASDSGVTGDSNTGATGPTV